MASVASGYVTSSVGGLVLTFTDTGSYSLPIVTKTLTIYDANGAQLAQYNMSANLTQTYNVTQDQYLSFVLSVVDQTGTVPPATVNYDAVGIYTAIYLQAMTALGCCGSRNNYFTMFKAELCQVGSQRFALSGYGVNANTMIGRANTYVNSVIGQ